jgi:hypothetical protein
MGTDGIGGTCERCSAWLNEARIVRSVFGEDDLSHEVEVSARLRLHTLAQRLVLHDCGGSAAQPVA